MPLAALDPDSLMSVVEKVHSDDLLPTALACKALYVCCRAHPEQRSAQHGPIWTTCGTCTAARVTWAVSCMGATPTPRWAAFACKRGYGEAVDCLRMHGVSLDAPIVVHAMLAVAMWGVPS